MNDRQQNDIFNVCDASADDKGVILEKCHPPPVTPAKTPDCVVVQVSGGGCGWWRDTRFIRTMMDKWRGSSTNCFSPLFYHSLSVSVSNTTVNSTLFRNHHHHQRR